MSPEYLRPLPATRRQPVGRHHPHRLPHRAHWVQCVIQRVVVHEERGLQADEAGGRGVEVVEAEDGPGVAGHGEGVAGHQGPGEGVVVQIVSLERGESGDQQGAW